MKTKGVHTGKAVDDTLQVVNDFTCQIPFWNYRVAEYRSYEPFDNLIPVIDEHLEKLFEGDIDDGNGDVLDCLIADYARETFKHLQRQHIDHRAMLKMFYVQREGAKESFEEHLVSTEAFYKQLAKERDEILRRYGDDKFEGGNNHED